MLWWAGEGWGGLGWRLWSDVTTGRRRAGLGGLRSDGGRESGGAQSVSHCPAASRNTRVGSKIANKNWSFATFFPYISECCEVASNVAMAVLWQLSWWLFHIMTPLLPHLNEFTEVLSQSISTLSVGDQVVKESDCLENWLDLGLNFIVSGRDVCLLSALELKM